MYRLRSALVPIALLLAGCAGAPPQRVIAARPGTAPAAPNVTPAVPAPATPPAHATPLPARPAPSAPVRTLARTAAAAAAPTSRARPVPAGPHAAQAAKHPAPAQTTSSTTPVARIATPALPARVSLAGSVQLVAAASQRIDAQDMADTVVYFTPDAGAVRPQPGHYTIATHHRMFDPSMLVIPLGSTVRFPNRDEILHNVYSVTPGSQFDLGLLGYGQSGQHTFTRPGLVLVNCNVHPSMQATIFVVASPYVARPAADGHFSLTGLPPGPGTLTVWQPRSTMLTRHIDLPLASTPVLRIVITKPRLLPHAPKSSVFPGTGAP